MILELLSHEDKMNVLKKQAESASKEYLKLLEKDGGGSSEADKELGIWFTYLFIFIND